MYLCTDEITYMMEKCKIARSGRPRIIDYVLTLITVTIWGVTFVSSKTLIRHGLDPVTIFILRFLLAYLCILPFSHRPIFAHSFKDEMWLLFAGVTGGSLYYITENSALSLTYATNVSLLISCTPIFTMFLAKIFFKDKISKLAWIGTLIAFVGVGFVVQKGASDFQVSLLGDALTLIAALSWAVYCLLLKRLNLRYSNIFINRKIFFYGITTALIWGAATGSLQYSGIAWASPYVIGNLLFLGVGASFLCYIMWNRAVKTIGVERTANYIYLVPLVSLVASALLLHEPITPATLLGALLIIAGVFLTSR